MLSPYDIAEHGTVVLEDLTANCHYLHDRSLIELMVGYNPPMFDAARIAPEGIEIYEDMAQFDKQFPRDPSEGRLRAPNIIPHMTQLDLFKERLAEFKRSFGYAQDDIGFAVFNRARLKSNKGP